VTVVNGAAAVAVGGSYAGGRWSNKSWWSGRSVCRRLQQQQQWLRKGSNGCSGGEPPGLWLRHWPTARDRVINADRVRRRLLLQWQIGNVFALAGSGQRDNSQDWVGGTGQWGGGSSGFLRQW
jgi:hypothetical protein